MSCPNCSPGYVPSPCPEQGIICHPNYLSMIEVPRIRLVGVPTGGQCQQFLQRKRGFVFDDGSGLGQFISYAPELTLPIINTPSGAAYLEPPSFPFFVIGTGANPHGWRFVQGKTGEVSTIQWNGTSYVHVAAGTSPTLVTACVAGTAANVTLFGCVQTGLDGDGNPAYALRRMVAHDNRAIVGAIDGDGVQTFHTLPDADALTHPIGKFTLTKWNTVQALNDDGTDTSGGLPQLVTYGTGGVVDAVACMYSPATKKFYLKPPGYLNTKAIAAVALTAGTFATIFDWTSIVLNYTSLQVNFDLQTGLDRKMTVDVLLDGVLKQEWTNHNGTAVCPQISGTILMGGINRGVHTVIIRAKSTTDDVTGLAGTACITTVDMP